MEPGVLSAVWSETFAGARCMFRIARLTSGATGNPIEAELHRMGKPPKSSWYTGVPRFPQ
jgi:hypothetical protein